MDPKTERKVKLQKVYRYIGTIFVIGVVILYMLSRLSPTTNDQTPLTLVGVSPQPPNFISPRSTEPVTLIFDSPIDDETISYEVTPTTRTKVIEDNNLSEISIVPLTGWDENVEYTITVSKELTSLTGRTLQEDVQVKFTRKVDYNRFPVEAGHEQVPF